MRGQRTTQEQIDWLRDYVANGDYSTLKDVAEAFNQKFGTEKTHSAIKQLCTRYGAEKPRNYTTAQIQWLKENAPGRTWEEVGKLYNETFPGNPKSAHTLRIYCNRKKIFTFTENGGKGWRRYGDGHTCKNSAGYSRVLTEHGYELKSRVEYEKSHGKIPDGYSVLHLNGDKNDFSPENLRAVPKGTISRFALMNRYSKGGMLKEDEELRKTAYAYCELVENMKKVARDEMD